MRKLGLFLHKSASGRLIIKMSGQVRPPRLGSKVFNHRGDFIGILIDIVGPVRGPYAIIKPSATDVVLESFEEVYVRCSS